MLSVAYFRNTGKASQRKALEQAAVPRYMNAEEQEVVRISSFTELMDAQVSQILDQL